MLKASGSALFLAIGLVLLVVGIAAVLYPAYTQWQHDLLLQGPVQEALPLSFSTSTTVATPTPVVDTPTPVPYYATATPLPTPTITPTPKPVNYGAATWLKVPSIKLDAKITEAPYRNNTFEVPLYDVGHHQGTPNPGSIGNSIYVGHVETINYGQVFAHLSEVKVGDAIYVYTATHRTDWVVTQVKKYPVGNISFLLQTSDARVTLYTCAGTWDWDRRDYNERLAVLAKLVGVSKTDRPTE